MSEDCEHNLHDDISDDILVCMTCGIPICWGCRMPERDCECEEDD